MITLSLCMIVKNEEDVLGRCLDCMKGIADEIIIVDTGSSDSTKEIALSYTPKVYDFTWCDDFAAARNFSFSKASMEYSMWLDADDIIDEQGCSLLMQLKNDLSPQTDMVMMKYDVAFDRKGRPTLSYYRERIFKTAMRYQWVGEIHEVISQHGRVEYREISILHKKVHPTEEGRNLRIFEKMLSDGKTLDVRQKYYYARELMYNHREQEAIQRFEEFLQEDEGWVENKISACKDLCLCYSEQGDSNAALQALLHSFAYDIPRAELCCDLGQYFLNQSQHRIATFWYELAAGSKMEDKSGAFCLPECYGYLPYIQLCVCYDKLGEHKKAMECNEKAGALKPDDPSYLYNKAYFESLGKIAGEAVNQ